jgi:hypothetical protein
MQAGPEFSIDAAPVIVTVLTVVLSQAVEAAVVPDRLKVDETSPAGRLKALREKLLGEAKRAFTEGAPYSTEATGMAEAMVIIDWVCDCVREQI